MLQEYSDILAVRSFKSIAISISDEAVLVSNNSESLSFQEFKNAMISLGNDLLDISGIRYTFSALKSFWKVNEAITQNVATGMTDSSETILTLLEDLNNSISSFSGTISESSSYLDKLTKQAYDPTYKKNDSSLILIGAVVVTAIVFYFLTKRRS